LPHHSLMRRRYFFILIFCFDTRIASGACLLPSLSFYLLALNWVFHSVDPFILLKYPRCRDRNKNNCCFSASFSSSRSMPFVFHLDNYSHLTCFSRGMYCFPSSMWGSKGNTKKAFFRGRNPPKKKHRCDFAFSLSH
jgi:hypothetical protein